MKNFRKSWIRVGQWCKNVLRTSLLTSIAFYKSVGAVHMGGGCRFEPSCSDYAHQVARIHSPGNTIRLVTSRLLRCRPGGPFGFDPVPPIGKGN